MPVGELFVDVPVVPTFEIITTVASAGAGAAYDHHGASLAREVRCVLLHDVERDVLQIAMIDRLGKGTGIGVGFVEVVVRGHYRESPEVFDAVLGDRLRRQGAGLA